MSPRLLRFLRHASTGQRAVQRAFPADAMEQIAQAVRDCEARHAGEIRFAVESSLPLDAAWHGVTARERALDVFSQLCVWDTEHNNGVLIYLLLADRAVEIVADRGVARERVAPSEWDAACRAMEQHLRDGQYLDAVRSGIAAVADVLARHPPQFPDAGNELPDAPVVLR
ncbi:MAG TPA: TPM domain-containing protein [Nevskiaceae bacterium]|nr:TPM domain-containing protein [Nevskiaceae bacterium]